MSQERSISSFAFLACLLALLLACFGTALFRDGQFAFRDAGHFYYPLYQRVQQEWEAGRLPLWEPEENAGMPLLGNPTAAVLYPGKIIYAVLAYPWAARMYVILHVVLAAAAMYALSRAIGTSPTGAALASLSFAFGAPILFQYCNIIFLVGAAWAPLGLRGAYRWIVQGRRWGLIELGLALCMQVLGGDPQSAYIVGLFSGILALTHLNTLSSLFPRIGRLRWWAVTAGILAWITCVLITAALLAPAFTGSPASGVPPPPPSTPFWLRPRVWSALLLIPWAIFALAVLRKSRPDSGEFRVFLGLAVSAVLAFALTAAQLLPVLEFTGQTVRAADYGSHVIFPFSLEPHRLVELFFPEPFGGGQSNRHWLSALPPVRAEKIWVPSLYMGGLTLLLALAAAGYRRGTCCSWLTSVTILSLALSLGQYASPLWHARNFPAAERILGPHDPFDYGESRRDGYLADGTGSPYWMLAWSLPGFRTFRYPSKLLTFSTLGIAGLAGLGWDSLTRATRTRRARSAALALVAFGGSALTLTYLAEPALLRFWKPLMGPDRATIFGPFDTFGALWDTRQSLMQGALVGAAVLVLIPIVRRRHRLASLGALVLLSADLIVANAALVWTVPQSLLDHQNTPEVIARILQAEKDSGSKEPFRVQRLPVWAPPAWRRISGNRVQEFVQWERNSIQPKYAIPYGLPYVLSEGTAELYDYWFFFAPFYGNHDDDLGRSLGLRPGEKAIYYPRRGFDLWNAKYFVLPVISANNETRGIASFLPDTELVYPPKDVLEHAAKNRDAIDSWSTQKDWQILRNKNVYPRAWIVHQAKRTQPVSGLGRRERTAVMEEILYQADPLWFSPTRTLWNPKEIAWVELEDGQWIEPNPSGGLPSDRESASITSLSPERVVIEASLDSPGIVILSDVFYPGWRLTIDGEPAQILRVNRMMRGASVASGRHVLVYSYEPFSVRVGLYLSAAGIAALLGMALWCRHQPTTLADGPE